MSVFSELGVIGQMPARDFHIQLQQQVKQVSIQFIRKYSIHLVSSYLFIVITSNNYFYEFIKIFAAPKPVEWHKLGNGNEDLEYIGNGMPYHRYQFIKLETLIICRFPNCKLCEYLGVKKSLLRPVGMPLHTVWYDNRLRVGSVLEDERTSKPCPDKVRNPLETGIMGKSSEFGNKSRLWDHQSWEWNIQRVSQRTSPHLGIFNRLCCQKYFETAVYT